MTFLDKMEKIRSFDRVFCADEYASLRCTGCGRVNIVLLPINIPEFCDCGFLLITITGYEMDHVVGGMP